MAWSERSISNVVLFLEHVERHVEIDRSRPAGQHQVVALPQRQRQHVHPRRLERALDVGPQHHRKLSRLVAVALLKRTAIELRGRHVRGDRIERRRIRGRAGRRHDQIAGAGAARGQGGDRLVRDAKVSVSHVAGGLLVARRDQLDLVLPLPQRVEQPDIAVSADTEDVRHPFLNQEIGDQISAFHAWHCVLPKLVVLRMITNNSSCPVIAAGATFAR